MHEKVFRYKLDFYYQSALIYLITLILYGAISGNIADAKFEYVLNDPIMYVIGFFVLMSFITLGLNLIRRRRLVILEREIVFVNRFRERRIGVKDIEWLHIGREARVRTSGRFQVVMLKLKAKRRVIRIRIGRYEREAELVQEMQRFAGMVPERKRPRWHRPKFTDR